MRKVVLQMMTTLNGRLDDPGAWVSVHPAVSAGAQWFDQIEGKRDLKLVDTTVYDDGIVGCYYERDGA